MPRRLLLSVLTLLAAFPLVLAFATPDDTSGDALNDGVPKKIVVEVTGRKFRWHFRYIEPDRPPQYLARQATDEELHLPVGASVELRFTSDDYIYVCSVPDLGIEQIAVPGLVNCCQCEAIQPATFDLLVDPLCGFRFYHDKLMGRIVISEEVRFLQPREPS